MFKHTSPLKFCCVQTPTSSISSLCQLMRSVQLVILLFLGLAAGKNVYAENSAPLQAQDLPFAEITPIANGSYETPWQIISLALDANENPRKVWLQNGSDQAYFVYAETNELNTSFTFEDGFSTTPPAVFNYYFSSSDEKYFYFFRDKRLQLSGGEVSFSFDNIQVDETTHEPSFGNLSINASGNIVLNGFIDLSQLNFTAGRNLIFTASPDSTVSEEADILFNGTPICGAPTNGTTPYSTTNAATLSWVGASEAATSAQNIETSCIETSTLPATIEGIVAADIFLNFEDLSNLMLAPPQSLLVGTPLISSEWAVTEGFITEQGGQAYAFSNGNNKAYLAQSSAEEYLTFADGYNLISLPDLTKVEFILTSPQTLEFDRWGGRAVYELTTELIITYPAEPQIFEVADYLIDPSGTLYIAEHSEESSIQIQAPKPPSRLYGMDYLILENGLSPDEIYSVEEHTIAITDSSASSDWMIPIPSTSGLILIDEQPSTPGIILIDEQPPTTDNSTKSSKKGGAQDELLVIFLFAILLRTQNTELNSSLRKIFKTN